MKKDTPLAFEVPTKSSYYKVDERLLEKQIHTRKNRQGEPYKKTVRRFVMSAVLLGAEVDSFTDVDKSMTCSRTYGGFASDLGISPASVNRGLNALADGGIIERVGQSEYASKLEKPKDAKDAPYIRVETWIFKVKVKDKRKDEAGNEYVYERELTNSEVLVFALIFTRCDNSKKGTNKFTASYDEIGNLLGFSRRKVSDAVRVLEANGLIMRSAIGVTRKYKNIFNINKRLLTRNRKAEAAAIATDWQLDSREREVWYAQRKQEAEERAERNEQKARTDNRFKAADTELRALASKEAFAELRGDLSELTQIKSSALKRCDGCI